MLLAMLFNANRSSKTKPAKVSDFHPFKTPERPSAMTREQLRSLRKMFTRETKAQRK